MYEDGRDRHSANEASPCLKQGERASEITPVVLKLHGCSPVNRLVGQFRGTIMLILRELLMGSQRPCHHGASIDSGWWQWLVIRMVASVTVMAMRAVGTMMSVLGTV